MARVCAMVRTSHPARCYFFGEHIIMDKDRIAGSAQEIKGKIKEVAGKVLGDAKVESEGKADKAAGQVQNAVGGVKSTLKGITAKAGFSSPEPDASPSCRYVPATVRAIGQGE
jgi:uncharacterized protein YjbJ (UPF0337 family)